MISVIIPTMWKPPHLMYILPMLQEHPLIGEVLIIDNDTSKTNPDIHKYSKVVHFPQKENIYVNPAWNLGVKLSKYDKLCFLNDDVIFNTDCLEFLYDKINPENGLMGFSEMSYCSFAPDVFNTLKEAKLGAEVYLEPTNVYASPETSGMPHVYYGCCMFLHKSRYFVIPDDFKIYYGDLFVYLLNVFNINHGEDIAPGVKIIKNTFKAVQNYTIEEGLVLTKMSSTVKGFNAQIEHEKKIFYDVFARYGIHKAEPSEKK